MSETTNQREHGQRSGPEASRMQGHWLLSSLGKRVLRPGGLGLTRRMIAAAQVQPGERVVELGPGVGATAELLLATGPSSYRGVDPNPQGREQVAAVLAGHPEAEYVVADAAATGLPDASADLVVGEAMLTIQGDDAKREIGREAARLLAPGGRYAIHEMGVREDRDETQRDAARRNLSRSIKVGARPVTLAQWRSLLEEAGLEVRWTGTAPMRLLEPTRVIRDEGLAGASRFVWRAVRTPGALRRLRAMRATFHAQGELINAVGLVAVKPVVA